MIRTLALLACALGVAALVARFIDVTSHAGLVVAVFAPYLMLGLPAAALALAVKRRWTAALCAAALTIAAFTVALLPTGFPHRSQPVENPVAIRVMSANTLHSTADARTIVALARDNADVVSIQELTPGGLDQLSANGMDAAFPHRVTKALWGGSGAGLWSRYPLRESPGGQFEGVPIIARITVPGIATDPTVAVVHLSAPWPWPIEWWRADIATATEVLSRPTDGALVAAGDFNSTRDVAQFRRLLGTGFQDATGRTYPANRWFPPLLSIDHILTRDSSSSSPRTVTVTGSDHRALLATVQIPR